MTLPPDVCWARLAGARRAVLATTHAVRGVDAVPVVFAVVDGCIVVPVDTIKPKRAGVLQRVINLERDARCVLVADHYDDDWSQLWWVRVHATGEAVAPEGPMLEALAARYPSYRAAGSVSSCIVLTPAAVTGWSA